MMIGAAEVMSFGMMAVMVVIVAVVAAAMYEPKPVPYMDGHY